MRLATETGLSLLEVMISLVILAIGLLGLAPFLVLSIETNAQSKEATLASTIAREKIEYLESLETIPASAFAEFESNVHDGYNRTTVIQDHASDTTIPDGLLRASIGVAWTDGAGQSRNTTVTTFLRNE